MPQEPSAALFDRLIDRKVLQRLLYSFSRSTGLMAVLVDKEGRPSVLPGGKEENCRFCQMIRFDDKGLKKCQRSYARAGIEAAKYGEPYIFRCHGGLIAWAAPILLDGQHIGSIICGQVLMWEPEDYFLEEIEEMVKELNVDLSTVKRAAAQLEVISAERVQAAADLLFVVANQIMKSGMALLEQRRQVAAQQARLGEEIQARKRAEAAMRRVEARSLRVYPLDCEQELMARVRNADQEESVKLLDNILVYILEKHSQHVDSLKARVMELLVVISRAAVSGGADLKEALQLNSQYFRELVEKDTPEEICFWIKNVLLTFISILERFKNSKNQQVINQAAEYMRQNFPTRLKIEDIARIVYLSPCYLSKIFKQELNCTVMEYLNQIRVDEAKGLLRDPKFNVLQVSREIGFEDPSYFTKVFKRYEGITPGEYRQRAL